MDSEAGENLKNLLTYWSMQKNISRKRVCSLMTNTVEHENQTLTIERLTIKSLNLLINSPPLCSLWQHIHYNNNSPLLSQKFFLNSDVPPMYSCFIRVVASFFIDNNMTHFVTIFFFSIAAFFWWPFVLICIATAIRKYHKQDMV